MDANFSVRHSESRFSVIYFVFLCAMFSVVLCQKNLYEIAPQCDPWANEWTRDTTDCSIVYYCVFGRIIQTHQCNNTRIWSDFGHACVMPMSMWDDCNQTPTTPTLNDQRCIDPNGLNPDPDNCAQFLACYNRTVVATMKCPTNTLFSVANNKTCALAILVGGECQGRNIPLDIDITTPSPIIDKPCSSTPNGDVPDPDDCRRFYKCNYGRVVARIRCPAGLAFTTARNKCDWRGKVDCKRKT